MGAADWIFAESEQASKKSSALIILRRLPQIAGVLRSQGKNGQAAELAQQALAVKTKVLGAEHSDTLTVFANLATILKDDGKYEAAEEKFWQSLRVKVQFYRFTAKDTNRLWPLSTILHYFSPSKENLTLQKNKFRKWSQERSGSMGEDIPICRRRLAIWLLSVAEEAITRKRNM